ncbi:MAG TPA: helix-turn-helix domain-containing protein [Sphingomicrobium sp.]|nr:helix-turn-helix domain-containing protein [Sphingomicrobium sp.]
MTDREASVKGGTTKKRQITFYQMEKHMNTDLIEGASNAAAFTGLSRRKIYRLAEQGHVPVIRKGRRLYFRKSELERAFMSAGELQ